jgi:hypothetical protein
MYGIDYGPRIWCNNIVYYYTCIYISIDQFFVRFKAVGCVIFVLLLFSSFR